MFKLSSQKNTTNVVVIFSLVFNFLFLALPVGAQFRPSKGALVDAFIDEQFLMAYSESDDWDIGEVLPIISQNSRIGVFAFVEVQNVKTIRSNRHEIKLKLLRQSRRYMIQKGDIVRKLDITSENPDFLGSTELVIKKSEQNISSKYRPLFYQGLTIGETAQTLYKNEFLVNFLGNTYFGVTEWLSIGSVLPGNALGKPNFNFKARFYESETTTLSTGLSYVRVSAEDESVVNMNFFWDSTSSDSLISHTFLSLGLAKWEGAADAAAIKALGSSSFQTGYEVISTDWNRILIGPSYNFEKKALGGYLSYVWIYDRMHTQVSINATDIAQFRLDPTNGYYGFIDFYWRF